MKRSLVFLPLVILLCFPLGCQDQRARADLEEFRAQAMTEERNEEVGRQLFTAIDENDFDKLGELLAPDFSLYVPGSPDVLGKEAVIRAIATHYAAFPDWSHAIDDVVAEGERVAIRLTQHGTHTADYEGIPATGNHVEMTAIHFVTIAEGRIKEWWVVEDYLGLFQQLDMELRPAAAGE